MTAIRQRIAARSLPAGARLPSIRALALSMRISPSTVVEAYERLVAEGVIRSRPGAGFFVTEQPAPLTLAAIGPRLDREIDPFWVSRASLEAVPTLPMPGCGWLPADWLPQDALRRGLRGLARAQPAMLGDYPSLLGLLPLRQFLARRLGTVGVEVPPQQVMLTDSGTQAIDDICRLCLEPGDAVLVDDPCYFNFLALLRAHRARIVGIPRTPAGPDLEAMETAIARHKPRLYITNSALHNPTGGTLSPVIAHRVLKLAAEAKLTIVEDDIFADFEDEPSPRLASFDGLERVIAIGSFSKTLSASIRCGYIAARPDWIERLADLKIATRFSGNGASAALVLTVLQEGGYRRHVEALRARLRRAMQHTIGALAKLDIQPWLVPKGGMFLWALLPNGIDAESLARASIEAGMVLAPGNVFSPGLTASNRMRFNVAQCQEPRVFALLEQAMALQSSRRAG
ncbi:aminotransferase-like domain-containing protein [Arboricoccus pini]|nr:PLP-dependent aminotransferase family protein [Arboricoccus pini]